MAIDPTSADFSEIRHELTCPICHGIIVDPVELPCGHPTCSECMNKWVANNSSCPVCNVPTQELPRPVSRILRRILERVTTKCDNTGCNAILTSDMLAHHKTTCIYQLEVCDNPICMHPVPLCHMASHRIHCSNLTDIISPYELMCVDCKLLQRLGFVAQHCSTVFKA